jgi:hypothetical protein
LTLLRESTASRGSSLGGSVTLGTRRTGEQDWFSQGAMNRRLESGKNVLGQDLRHQISAPPPVCGKTVLDNFDRGLRSSDGGVVVLREVEQRLRVAERMTRR